MFVVKVGMTLNLLIYLLHAGNFCIAHKSKTVCCFPMENQLISENSKTQDKVSFRGCNFFL